MPGPKTHDIYYKQLKGLLSPKTISSFPNYDDYRIFAQGHDLFIYHDFYKIRNQVKLNENIEEAVLLQEDRFPEFIYNYLKFAIKNGSIEDEQTRLFIGPGYAMHHILDAYIHPQIIYYSGDHTRNPNSKTWKHGVVENLLDIYMMKQYENNESKKYRVYKDFEIDNKRINDGLVDTLNSSLKETYSISNGGKIIKSALYDTRLFMRVMKYDPTGIKRVIFDAVDPFLKGTKSFSYHRNYEEALPYLNLEHETWLNPMNASITSTDSFIDLYNKALLDGSKIVDELEKICQGGTINKDDIYSIIPNISSVHGLECGKKLEIFYKKNW